ncbi:hypothetical protein [Sulfurovum mangrovi]|uniref:hypothetical protein n=1 Tax=Sulfurovum mangrovi TaxID=2893889 RepID=UPI001E3F40D3|nr:hypothetical protein [Sulfurovum mangrovi]UFH60279.1 hypothetical protein LN246_05370 [Sulfurovum mangrovi]
MGMILGPIYLLGIWFYVLFYQTMRTRGMNVFSSLFVTFIATLPFTYDIVITYILAFYHCYIASPHPKTEVVKKVEYPEGIYWEDNVYPGFSKGDRVLMILNYLDGKHLKSMALNGNDGKIYVYHLKEPLWSSYQEEHKELKGLKLYESYAYEVMKNEKVYTKESMPIMNYTVKFDEVRLNTFTRKFLYSDETKVIENNTDQVIAHSRRYMRLFFNIEPNFLGGDLYHYYSSVMCGQRSNSFEDSVLQASGPINYGKKHEIYLNKYLYLTKRKK